MKRVTTLLSLVLLLSSTVWSQQRYLDEVFANVSETQNVRFSTQVPQPKKGGGWYATISAGLPINVKEHDTYNRDLYMDIFQPFGDTKVKRPVFIVCFGGGFVIGNRKYGDIRDLAISMAKRGYVTAAIDYRLGMNVFDEGAALRAVYRGVQDGRSAVRYFRANAERLGIDPDQIFLAGHSAGGFIALQNAYLDRDAERPAATRSTRYRWKGWFRSKSYNLPDQGCLDCVGDNKHLDGKANAVVSLAGALGYLEHIEGSTDVPTLMFHSSNDLAVSYGAKQPFKIISPLVVGFDLPVSYGGSMVDGRARDRGAPRKFYSYNRRGHFVHVKGGDISSFFGSVLNLGHLHTDVLPRISQFLYDTRLRPAGFGVSGATVVRLSATNTQTYTADVAKDAKVQWQVEGGKIVKQAGNQVTISWNTPGEHVLSAVPYNTNGAKGDAVKVPVLVMDNLQELKADLQMYPNPSARVLKIKLNEEDINEVKAIVYNERGQTIYQGSLQKQGTQFNLNVLKLPLGKYYIKIQNGERMLHKTFLKY
ncbi:carboxylesterase family protein [uncultured Microscilla sp.]|uniref:carboxylesterase family protein n=1 Tax=uncultured Microscilla sp. TaxID=432653 RepID=UPI0026345A2F|nr:carboxylesterase family protein [uncultured Microscilla sp.]